MVELEIRSYLRHKKKDDTPRGRVAYITPDTDRIDRGLARSWEGDTSLGHFLQHEHAQRNLGPIALRLPCQGRKDDD